MHETICIIIQVLQYGSYLCWHLERAVWSRWWGGKRKGGEYLLYSVQGTLSLSRGVYNQEIKVHVKHFNLSVCHDVVQRRQSEEIDHDCVKPSQLKMLKIFMVHVMWQNKIWSLFGLHQSLYQKHRVLLECEKWCSLWWLQFWRWFYCTTTNLKAIIIPWLLYQSKICHVILNGSFVSSSVEICCSVITWCFSCFSGRK